MAHFLIIDARFYENISDELVRGAEAELGERGATCERISVPGVLEIPTALAMAARAKTSRFDGYVLLGCVIRGETTHYEIVANESARAILAFAVAEGLAIGNGILTVENAAQAWARARDGAKDERGKGRAAAEAAFRMAELKAEFGR